MDGIKIDGVLFPKELIVLDGKLEGYTMDYFKSSIPLSRPNLSLYIMAQ